MTAFEVDYGEVVAVEPGDLGQALKVAAGRCGGPWTLHADLVAAVVEGRSITMPAMLLWRLTAVADPVLLYSLDEADGATYERPDVQAYLRLEAALFQQAPRTTAAMMAVADAELAVARVEWET